jgi:hypothetical protein
MIQHDSLKTSLTESKQKLLLFLQPSPPFPGSNVSAYECEIFECSLTDNSTMDSFMCHLKNISL